jgi:hypothetical protein
MFTKNLKYRRVMYWHKRLMLFWIFFIYLAHLCSFKEKKESSQEKLKGLKYHIITIIYNTEIWNEKRKRINIFFLFFIVYKIWSQNPFFFISSSFLFISSLFLHLSFLFLRLFLLSSLFLHFFLFLFSLFLPLFFLFLHLFLLL